MENNDNEHNELDQIKVTASTNETTKKTRFVINNEKDASKIEYDESTTKSEGTTTNVSVENESTILCREIDSPYQMKFGKRIDYDSEDNRKNYGNDSNSIITNSSDESERIKRKKYDIEYQPFKRSKSTSGLFKHKKPIFPAVREERQEDEGEQEIDCKNSERFKKINLMIMQEGYDNVEESLSEHRPKILSTRSTKCLSLMDPVLEVKEEIDFNQIKLAPFKKLKYIVDADEDVKIGNTPNQHHFKGFDVDTIEEDNRENDAELEFKTKYHTHNIKKIPDFVDKSDMIKQVETKHYITEEIKEDTEHEEQQEDIIHNPNCKILHFLFNFFINLINQ